MLFVTLAPFVIVGLTAGPYWLIQRFRANKLKDGAQRRLTSETTTRICCCVSLFAYFILPSISTFVITYFSCSRFADDGVRRGLRVITSELSVKCTNSRYRHWRVYAGSMILIYPIGVPFVFAILLWRNRAKLNPPLDDETTPTEEKDGVVARLGVKGDGFQRRGERRHAEAMKQRKKLELRDADHSLAALKFVFDEYEPRCYLFPIFEIARRIFLTSVLAIFYPGSTRQSVIGLLGAMLACAVYYYYEPFVEDDDNVVSAVAQGELVLLYFAALAIFASQEAGDSRQAFSGVGFGVVLVLIFFASFLVTAYIILLDTFGWSRLRRAYDSLSRSVARAFSPNAPRDLEITTKAAAASPSKGADSSPEDASATV